MIKIQICQWVMFWKAYFLLNKRSESLGKKHIEETKKENILNNLNFLVLKKMRGE